MTLDKLQKRVSGRDCASHSVALPSGQVLVGDLFLSDGDFTGSFPARSRRPSPVGEVLLWERKEEKFGHLFFLTIWKKRNRIAFREGTLVLQRLKLSFVHNLWSWNRLYYLGEEISSTQAFWNG